MKFLAVAQRDTDPLATEHWYPSTQRALSLATRRTLVQEYFRQARQ
jgi:hypothetical protein